MSDTVTFNSNGGSDVAIQTIADGGKVTKPTAPTKEEYIFDGWYKEENFKNPYDFNSKVTKSFTLYTKWKKSTVSDSLNTAEHFAYIKGYNNKVRPSDNITRAETAEIFYRLLNENTMSSNFTQENSFTDVAADAWYNTSVSTMAKLGILKGRADGLFTPTAFITRAEFAVICARFDDSDYEVTLTFSDVSGHWAENEIYEAASRGWINGYDDSTFRPDEFITRAEAITLINRMLG